MRQVGAGTKYVCESPAVWKSDFEIAFLKEKEATKCFWTVYFLWRLESKLYWKMETWQWQGQG